MRSDSWCVDVLHAESWSVTPRAAGIGSGGPRPVAPQQETRFKRPRAAQWYREATDQDCGKAQAAVGVMSQHGDGVPQDDVQAFAWMAISAMGREVFGRSILDSPRERMTASRIEAARKLSIEHAVKVPP